MNNKKKIIIASLAFLLIVVLALAWLMRERNNDNFVQDQYEALGQMKNNANQAESANLSIEDGEIVIPGADIISTEKIVVNDLGTPVKVDVMPNSPEAPKAVEVVKKDLAAEVIEIGVANNSFSPNTFSVSAGAPVSLAISSNDNKTHVITFTDSSLAALAFGVPAGRTKAMTFNAPLEAGRYEFKCDVPGHSSKGEVGYMIVE